MIKYICILVTALTFCNELVQKNKKYYVKNNMPACFSYEELNIYCLLENINNDIILGKENYYGINKKGDTIEILKYDSNKIVYVKIKDSLLIEYGINKKNINYYKEYFLNGNIHYEIYFLDMKSNCSQEQYLHIFKMNHRKRYKTVVDSLISRTYYPNGEWLIYDEQGFITEQFSIKNCSYQGEYKKWNDGSLSKINHYKNGKLDGITSHYDKKGELMYNEIFKNDSLIEIKIIDINYTPPHYYLLENNSLNKQKKDDSLILKDENGVKHLIYAE